MKVKCDNCNTEFDKKKAQIKRSVHHFCCKQCHDVFRKGKSNLARRRRIVKECDNCGGIIEVQLSRYKTFNYHFCNQDCEYEWMKKSVKVTCDLCGKEFERTLSQYKRGNVFFCSRKCSENGKKLNKHWNWQGGKSFEKYGVDFDNVLKELVRKRDEHTCQECQFTEKQLGYKLNIHHIDYDKRNNKMNNLISLCNNCHSQSNYSRDDWVKYYMNKIKKQYKNPNQLMLF